MALRTPAVFRDDGTLMALKVGDSIAVTCGRAVPVSGLGSGSSVSHGLGTTLGLTMAGYYLELRAYDSAGNFVTGITATKTSADAATITFTDTSISFSGTFIFTAISY